MSVIIIITNTYTEAMPTKVAWRNSKTNWSEKHLMYTIDFPQIIDLSNLNTTETTNLEVYCLEAFYLPVDNLQNICFVGHGWISHTPKSYNVLKYIFKHSQNQKSKLCCTPTTLDIKQSKKVNCNFTCIFLLVIIFWQSWPLYH